MRLNFVVFLSTLLSLLSISLATPLVDIVKNQVQVLGGKGHPEDALIHLIRTDDLLSDDQKSQILERQSHLVFKIHYDEADNSIYINGGKIDLSDSTIINSDEPLRAGPVIKVESLKLSGDELKETEQIKKEHLEKLPKGIIAAQLRLKSVDIDENTRRLIVFIKVLEDNGAHHAQNPIFTLQVTQHAPNPAQEIMDKAKLQADREAFIGRIKENMKKMHHKVYKIVGLRPPHKHLMLPPPPVVMLKHGNEMVKVPCKMSGAHPHPHAHAHHAHGVHPPQGQHPHDHPHPHHHHKPCLKERVHKMFAALNFKLHNMSQFTLFLVAFFAFWSCATLVHFTVALRRARQQRLYESLPTYEQVEVVVGECDKEAEKI